MQVTICAALFRGFPWKYVPVYIFSQVLGAYLGSLIVYADYFHAIDLVEGKGIRTVPGTAGLFSPYPVRFSSEELMQPIPDKCSRVPCLVTVPTRCELLL